MDPVVLDLPTTAWGHPPAISAAGAKLAFLSQAEEHFQEFLDSEWVADGGEGWGETLFLPCAPRLQSSNDSLKDRLYSGQGKERSRSGIHIVFKSRDTFQEEQLWRESR